MSTLKTAEAVPLDEIRAAKDRIADAVVRTPLVRLNVPHLSPLPGKGEEAGNVDGAPAEIYLKLENLQPIGAFKLRGAINAMRLADKEQLGRGVWTVSSGNMALGVAWSARKLGVDCTVLVADDAPEAKLAAISRLGARTIKVPWLTVLEVCGTRHYDGMDGLFIHPFSDPGVMAGNATIGLEIVEDLPDVDAVIVPYGGGGLSCAVASAVRALKPDARVYACEVETAAPAAASFAAGRPTQVEQIPTFVSGIGSPFVFEEMWPLV